MEMAELAEKRACGLGIAPIEFPHLGIELVVEGKVTVAEVVGRRHLRIKSTLLLGFLAVHNRPTDGLDVGEDSVLDGVVFFGVGHAREISYLAF